jgi:hypothetical protein
MIDHERARELASLSRDPGLDPADLDQLDEHLATCEACRLSIGRPAATPALHRSTTARSRFDRRGIRALIRRPAFLAVVAVVALALVAGGLAWNAGQQTRGVADAGHPLPTPSPGASASAEASGAPDPWASLAPSVSFEPLAGEAATPTAILTAVGATGVVVPLEAGFRLASVDATPASRLAARLTVQPTFAFSIKPEADDRAVLLTPSEPLQAGVVYRFALSGTSGELLDSWAFQARQPLRVVGTLPNDKAADVPVDTGIEITFDQDGVIDPASHVTLKPATTGRFEQHGRTTVFVPDHGLAPATVYTVTVSRGVTVGGTGEASDAETRFQFETAGSAASSADSTFFFPDQVVESPTAERPTIGLWSFGEAKVPPKTLRIEVYRLADLDAGIAAFQSLRARPDWSRWSKEGLVETNGLRRVVAVDARLNPYRDAFWVQLPERLPAGWYLVQLAAGTLPSQAVLQVTDVAGYLAVSETRTLVWANDLKSGRPIVGATVASGGTRIGQTDTRGVALGSTPMSLAPEPSQTCVVSCDPVVTVRTLDGRAIFLPTTSGPNVASDMVGSFTGSDADPGFWSLLHTDRGRYRPTDPVNVWGVVRGRDNGTVPASVTIRVSAQSNGADVPAIASLTVKPGPTGAFIGSVPSAGLAEGAYDIDLLVGSRVVRSIGISVGPIAKPAYRLAVETGRRVYIEGDRIKITATANFFEGTPVPGVPLRINGLVERDVTTDASGTAIYRTTATTTGPNGSVEGPLQTSVGVAPARAEEGEITGASRDFVIFPSTRTIDAGARFAQGKVRVTGAVHLVAVDRLEAEIAAGREFWSLDPRGAAVRDASVTVRFVELIPHRTQTGTENDFIEKKVVPKYDVSIVERAAGSVVVKTAANGSYAASITAPNNDHDYQILVSVGDAAGHVARSSGFANRHPWTVYDGPAATLRPTGTSGYVSTTFGVGDRVDLTMTDPATKQAAGDGSRYLFFRAQRGIRDVTVRSSPRFVTTFAQWAAPNLMIGSVRFTGHGYVGTEQFVAQFRAADRRLQVDLSVRAARYAPGDLATVDVTTRTASGAPTAATVILRAVDEKLFAIGDASQDDPLTELYASVTPGILGTYVSHRDPRALGGGGGDTTGGGRNDFRDSLLFKMIATDANGRGSVSFRVSDDLTSWRVNASAVTARLEAGAGSVLVPVGLPFFVDASIAPEYLLADRPSIAVRAFGSAVAAGDAVTIEVTSTSLGYDSGPIKVVAFATTAVPLPALRLGTQTVTISATSGTGAAARTDRLTRSFAVVATRLTRARSASVELPASGPFSGGDGLTTVIVSDAGAARDLPLLTDLASGGGARLDRSLAADIATSLLASRYGSTSADPIGGTFSASRYQTPDGGLALLPYSSSDLELSALVAIIAPDHVDRTELASYLRTIRADPKETRERQMFALAGLASLGDPVLPALRLAAADATLTIHERLMLGLGAAASGDAATARSVAASVTAEHGERLGGQARLRVGTSGSDITTATALMAVLAAAVGDSRAPLFWAYVEANPIVDQLEVLPAAAYATYRLDRLPMVPASFAYTVDGTRTVVALATDRSFELSLNARQLAGLRVEGITGSIGVTTSWREPIQPAAVQSDRDVSISRSVKPSTTIDSTDLMTVDLTVTFGPQAAAGCHQVTELVPSGLTPVGSLATWIDPNSGEAPPPGVVMPYDQTGQRVFFCAEPTGTQRTVQLRYYARVITSGTYAWEPAIAESRSQEGVAALTAAGEIVVR